MKDPAPDRPGPPIHDGAEYMDLPDDPAAIDYVHAAAVLMARVMNRYWDVCQQHRRPVSQQLKFRIDAARNRVVCECKFW